MHIHYWFQLIIVFNNIQYYNNNNPLRLVQLVFYRVLVISHFFDFLEARPYN
jgi:hypothetical protein